MFTILLAIKVFQYIFTVNLKNRKLFAKQTKTMYISKPPSWSRGSTLAPRPGGLGSIPSPGSGFRQEVGTALTQRRDANWGAAVSSGTGRDAKAIRLRDASCWPHDLPLTSGCVLSSSRHWRLRLFPGLLRRGVCLYVHLRFGYSSHIKSLASDFLFLPCTMGL